MKSLLRFFPKILLTMLTLYLSTMVAAAQNQSSVEETPEQLAAKKIAESIVQKAKTLVQEQTTQSSTTENNEGILSLLSKTIEELEERAERQYQNNRYVFIRED